MCYYKPYEEFCQGVNQNFSRKFLKNRIKQRQCVSLVKSHLDLILLNNLIIFIFDIMFVIYYLLYIYILYLCGQLDVFQPNLYCGLLFLAEFVYTNLKVFSQITHLTFNCNQQRI